MHISREDQTQENKDNFPLAPAGNYSVKIITAKKAFTAGGSEFWKVFYQISSGEHSGGGISDNFFFSEKAMHRTIPALKALGFDVSQGFELEPEALMGLSVIVDSEIIEYNEQKYAKVKGFNSYHPITKEILPF